VKTKHLTITVKCHVGEITLNNIVRKDQRGQTLKLCMQMQIHRCTNEITIPSRLITTMRLPRESVMLFN